MSEAKSNARWLRNASKGIEGGGVFGLHKHDVPRLLEIADALEQRDALLEACKAAEKAIGGECDIKDCENCKAYRKLVAAIALAEQEPTQ